MNVRLIERTHVLTGKLRTCGCGRTHFCVYSDAWCFHTNVDFYRFFRTMNNCPFLFAYCTLQNRCPFCPLSHYIDVFCVLMAAIVAAKMTSLTAKLCWKLNKNNKICVLNNVFCCNLFPGEQLCSCVWAEDVADTVKICLSRQWLDMSWERGQCSLWHFQSSTVTLTHRKTEIHKVGWHNAKDKQWHGDYITEFDMLGKYVYLTLLAALRLIRKTIPL